jgi:hypothetical protein
VIIALDRKISFLRKRKRKKKKEKEKEARQFSTFLVWLKADTIDQQHFL